MGFDRIAFRGELQRARPLAECGVVFHGVCDSSLTAVLRQELVREPERRQFVYWLTLSSHFPLDPRAPLSADACGALGAAGRDGEVCALWTALWPVLQGVARVAADPAVPPTRYILVGDHAPRLLRSGGHPFLDDRVPFIELRPRP